MYWPEFLTAPFRKAGGVFGVGMGGLAVVFGVVAFKVLGVLVLVGVGMVLLCVELWRDAGKVARERDACATSAADEKAARDRAEAEAATLRSVAEAEGVCHERVEELELEIATLRSQLASPALSPQQLIISISNQVALIDMTIRHRSAASDTGAGPWPVVRVSPVDDGYAMVQAYISNDVAVQAEDWVALQIEAIPGFAAFGQVMFAGDRDLTAHFDRDFLPPVLAQQLDASGDQNPRGLTLTLAGLLAEPYGNLEDRQLVDLRTRLVAVADSLSSAIVTPQAEPQEPES